MEAVLLCQKGDLQQIKLKGTSMTSFTSAMCGEKSSKKKEQVQPQIIGSYPYKSKTLIVFGFMEGKDNTESEHMLPPPLDGITLFGNILVILSNNANSYTSLSPLKVAEYDTFWQSKMEGDGEEEEELEELQEADVKDDEEPEEEEEETNEDYESEKEDETVEVGEDTFEEDIVPEKIIKPIRVRKTAIVVSEEPEIEDTATIQESSIRQQV
jgi:hypothetical protein